MSGAEKKARWQGKARQGRDLVKMPGQFQPTGSLPTLQTCQFQTCSIFPLFVILF